MYHKTELELLRERIPSVDDNRLKEMAVESASKAASFMPLDKREESAAVSALTEYRYIRLEMQNRTGMDATIDDTKEIVRPLLMALTESAGSYVEAAKTRKDGVHCQH